MSFGWLPILSVLRGYRREWLRADVFAGISVCVVMIPSVIAYAELADLPPVHGLYAALAAMVGYAIFASSRHVITGPDAAITLLMASAIGPLAGGDPGRLVSLTALTALLGGSLMLLAAYLRVGVVADFLSKPVLVGYLTGAALVLISTQLGKLFGLSLSGYDFFPVLAELVSRLGETHTLTLSIGLGFIALLAILQRFVPNAPGPLVVLVLALAISWMFDLESRGVRVLGSVDRGLPLPRWPGLSPADAALLLPAAAGIVLLTFPEGVLLSRAFAAKHRYDVRPNQELTALAASNLLAGLFQGFCVGASQSRTTVNDAAGGKTQVVSLVAAGALALFLLFLTPMLTRLPVVALASILVFAGASLVGVREYAVLLRFSRMSLALALGVAVAVLAVGVLPGILLGLIASLVYVLGRLARPMDAVLEEAAGTGRYHDLGNESAAHTVPGLIAYRFYSPLFFANADWFVDRIRGLVAGSPYPVRWVLLDAQAIWEIDLTATEALTRLHEELRARGISLKIARANRPLREKLARIGLKERLGLASFFPSVHKAVEAFQREAGASGV